MFSKDLVFLTFGQVTAGLVIVFAWYLIMQIIVRVGLDLAVWFSKRKSVSGQTYLYHKDSDIDFFDQITEFRNGITR